VSLLARPTSVEGWAPRLLAALIVAGTLAMHGVTLIGPAHAAAELTGMHTSVAMDERLSGKASSRAQPAVSTRVMPGRPGHDHTPAADGHHHCIATLAALPLVPVPTAAGPAQPTFHTSAGALSLASTAAPRAPPDLHRLCISRT
jgi:hypothetical protein